ncbi:MAG: STAS domain-containing protein [Candidatus Latescibacteria bacterium]|jgi:anti-anti-sigma regulatory factor|nr:STAS domain-containing protein [Candidatus Latescibacterota bacterium]
MAESTQFRDREGQQWIALTGDAYIDGNSGQRILDLALVLLEKGLPRVAVDLSPTRVVNSVGISRFIQMVETFESGNIAFCGASNAVAKTLRIMGLLQKAVLCDSIEEAATTLPLSGGKR